MTPHAARCTGKGMSFPQRQVRQRVAPRLITAPHEQRGNVKRFKASFA